MFELLAELLLWPVAEKFFWCIGAVLMKIAGKPLTPTDDDEAMIGFGFFGVLIVTLAFYLSHTP